MISRSEFLNQYLGSSTIFTKAKRSLTNSFDQLLKRKGSRDDFGATLKGMNLPIANNLNRVSTETPIRWLSYEFLYYLQESSPHSPAPSIVDISDKESEGTRSRSSTIGSQNDLKDHLSIREQGHKGSVSPDRSIGSEKGVKSPMMDM